MLMKQVSIFHVNEKLLMLLIPSSTEHLSYFTERCYVTTERLYGHEFYLEPIVNMTISL
ncbi:hypothetical protein SK128_026588, partial [Halocaridina rubra]